MVVASSLPGVPLGSFSRSDRGRYRMGLMRVSVSVPKHRSRASNFHSSRSVSVSPGGSRIVCMAIRWLWINISSSRLPVVSGCVICDPPPLCRRSVSPEV